MIPISRPNVTEDEAVAVAATVVSGWLTQGPRVEEFEATVADFVGARHAIATSNCTTALHLALLSAGVGPLDEVICPSLTFIATANAIVHAGATPVFVDVDPDTYNIDVGCIEKAITARTKAIMPVDQIGLAADIPTILAIAERHGLKVIEDAAPSLGATIGALRVGSLSDLTCFSFHPRKIVTTGEGGIVTTDDDEAERFLRRARSHGASTSDLARHSSRTTTAEHYADLGYNYRMTDIQAALGNVQMRRLEALISERRRLATRYNAMLAGCDQVATPFEPDDRCHTYQSYCVRVRGRRSRDEIMNVLAGKGVATRRGVMAIHLEPYYRSRYPGLSLPATEAAASETLLLPLFPGLTDEEQATVVEGLLESLR